MRFSEERIRHLARKMAREMIRTRAVESTAGEEGVTSLISQRFVLMARREAEIDKEARGVISRQRTAPPEGSSDWEYLYSQIRRDVASRHGVKW